MPESLQVYLVGGAVRDALLGLPVRERDWVVVGTTPETMERLGYRRVGRDFPVFLHPKTQEEHALARLERKTAPGYRGFTTEFSPQVTLEQDLARRDLTVNAIARAEEGGFIDPYGGRDDLKARVLRHVSPAFVEDPVRVLRVARFAARFAGLGFSIAPETRELMRSMVDSGELAALVAERVWQETERALGEDQPQVFFQVLRDCGALAVIFPEIDVLFGVPQPAQWHPEIDTGIHVMAVLEMAARLSPAIATRFAALTHDLGKGVTPREIWPKHTGHEAHSARLVEALCDRLRVPNECRELARLVARHHGVVHRAAELRAGTVLELFEKTDAFRRPERFQEFLLACEADSRGRAGLESRPYPQRQWLSAALMAAKPIVPTADEIATLQGEAIAQALKQRRVAAIAQCLAECLAQHRSAESAAPPTNALTRPDEETRS